MSIPGNRSRSGAWCQSAFVAVAGDEDSGESSEAESGDCVAVPVSPVSVFDPEGCGDSCAPDSAGDDSASDSAVERSGLGPWVTLAGGRTFSNVRAIVADPLASGCAEGRDVGSVCGCRESVIGVGDVGVASASVAILCARLS